MRENVHMRHVLWYLCKVRTSFVIVGLSFSACTGAKYGEDVGPGTVSSSPDDVSDGEDGSAGDDTGMVGISIDAIPGAACANAEQAWPFTAANRVDWSNQTVFLATEMIPTGPWGSRLQTMVTGFPTSICHKSGKPTVSK